MLMTIFTYYSALIQGWEPINLFCPKDQRLIEVGDNLRLGTVMGN